VELAAELVPHFTVYTYDRRGRGDAVDLFMAKGIGLPGWMSS